MRRHRRGRRLLVAPALAVALAVALGSAGCGGSPSAADAQVASANGTDGVKATAKDPATKKADAEKAGLDFAKCMREHGVDMPDPQTGGGPGGGGGFIMVGPSESAAAGGSATATAGATIAGDTLPEEIKAADEACRHFLGDLVQDGGPPMDAEAQDNALKFAKCMREHGVDMPDPDFSSGGGGFSIQIGGDSDGDGGGIDPGSQTFQDAQKACGGMFGPGGGGPGGAGEVHAITSGTVRS